MNNSCNMLVSSASKMKTVSLNVTNGSYNTGLEQHQNVTGNVNMLSTACQQVFNTTTPCSDRDAALDKMETEKSVINTQNLLLPQSSQLGNPVPFVLRENFQNKQLSLIQPNTQNHNLIQTLMLSENQIGNQTIDTLLYSQQKSINICSQPIFSQLQQSIQIPQVAQIPLMAESSQSSFIFFNPNVMPTTVTSNTMSMVPVLSYQCSVCQLMFVTHQLCTDHIISAHLVMQYQFFNQNNIVARQEMCVAVKQPAESNVRLDAIEDTSSDVGSDMTFIETKQCDKVLYSHVNSNKSIEYIVPEKVSEMSSLVENSATIEDALNSMCSQTSAPLAVTASDNGCTTTPNVCTSDSSSSENIEVNSTLPKSINNVEEAISNDSRHSCSNLKNKSLRSLRNRSNGKVILDSNNIIQSNKSKNDDICSSDTRSRRKNVKSCNNCNNNTTNHKKKKYNKSTKKDTSSHASTSEQSLNFQDKIVVVTNPDDPDYRNEISTWEYKAKSTDKQLVITTGEIKDDVKKSIDKKQQKNCVQLAHMECGTCGKHYRDQKNLTRHKRTHGPRNYICTVCGRSFIELHNFKQHYKNHKRILPTHHCQHCSNVYRHAKDLTDHMIRCHPSTAISKKYVRNIVCTECGVWFSRKPHLLRHIRKFHNDETNESGCDCKGRYKRSCRLCNS